MKARGSKRGSVIPALAAAFCIGMLAGWYLRSWGAPQPALFDSVKPEITARSVLSPDAKKEADERGHTVATIVAILNSIPK